MLELVVFRWSAHIPRVYSSYGRSAQLYEICAEVGDRMMPCLYALLPGATSSMYQHIITKIKEFARTLHHQDVQWNSCMLDFESPARMAMTNSIVGIRVRGCLFHMAQTIMRRIRRENHTLQLYSRDQNFRLWIQRLTALAFLPVDRVVSTYAVLLASAVSKSTSFMERS